MPGGLRPACCRERGREAPSFLGIFAKPGLRPTQGLPSPRPRPNTPAADPRELEQRILQARPGRTSALGRLEDILRRRLDGPLPTRSGHQVSIRLLSATDPLPTPAHGARPRSKPASALPLRCRRPPSGHAVRTQDRAWPYDALQPRRRARAVPGQRAPAGLAGTRHRPPR